MMELKDRIKALTFLGEEIMNEGDWLEPSIARAYHENKWFTPENSKKALDAIANQFLQESILESWISRYEIGQNEGGRKVGLVLAGNIPLVGFHDVMSTFISGNIALIKCSSKDEVLMKAVIEQLTSAFPEAASYFEFSDKLVGFDAVIATGSNNSSRYFEQYFGKYPHIIRKNRNAIGILDGNESKDDFLALGEDIFNYFGLGCRNVSKIYVPRDYEFDALLGVLHDSYKEVIHHNKYKNNFDYNNALFLLNKVDFFMSGSLIVTASREIASRIATLHYEEYDDLDQLSNHLAEVEDQIQCIVGKAVLAYKKTFAFGQAQKPAIDDYADGVDTLEFLTTL